MKITKGVIVAAMASVAFATSVPFLVTTEIRVLNSVHAVYVGHPITVRLAPGVYNFNQDPGTGTYPNADLFSVTGEAGPVEVTKVRGGFFEGLLGVFVGTQGFAPAGSFRIIRPGDYRVELQGAIPDLDEVVVTEPYTEVATRVATSGAVALWSLVTLAVCLARVLRRRPMTGGAPGA